MAFPKKLLFALIPIIGLIACILLWYRSDATEAADTSAPVFKGESEDRGSLDEKDEAGVRQETTEVIIDIKGEVQKPGVYTMDGESRVNDAIALAGGFTENAKQDMVNLAQKVRDEMVILIPGEGDDEGDTSLPYASSDAGLSNGEQKININLATQDEIESLNGIGPAKAEAIIQYREENGDYQTAEDLMEVSGIGEKTLESFVDSIQVP